MAALQELNTAEKIGTNFHEVLKSLCLNYPTLIFNNSRFLREIECLVESEINHKIFHEIVQQ